MLVFAFVFRGSEVLKGGVLVGYTLMNQRSFSKRRRRRTEGGMSKYARVRSLNLNEDNASWTQRRLVLLVGIVVFDSDFGGI